MHCLLSQSWLTLAVLCFLHQQLASAILLPLVAHLLESFGALNRLEGVVSTNGRAFYRVPVTSGEDSVTIRRTSGKLIEEQFVQGEQSVVPFWAGKPIGWEIVGS